jgi:ABC-type transport system substrate-binding protein
LPSSLSRAVATEGTIMPKAYIEKVGEEEFRKKPIGSGPWKFVRSVPGDRIEFEAVDYPHFRGTPHFKELHILLVPEESTRVSMVRTGEGGDRLDRAGIAAERGARRPPSPVGARHDAGGVSVLGRLSSRIQGQPDRQAAR